MAGVQCSFERVEKKFVLTHAQAEALMRDLTAGYMAVDQYGQHTIRNLYYDTDDYALIRRSIQRPKYKVKFRLRAYGTPMEDSLIFAELKKKYSGVVYKRRIAVSPDDMRRFLRGETLDETKPLTIFHPLETWKRTTVSDFRAEELLHKIVENGKLVYEFPRLTDLREYAHKELSTF